MTAGAHLVVAQQADASKPEPFIASNSALVQRIRVERDSGDSCRKLFANRERQRLFANAAATKAGREKQVYDCRGIFGVFTAKYKQRPHTLALDLDNARSFGVDEFALHSLCRVPDPPDRYFIFSENSDEWFEVSARGSAQSN